MEQGQFQGKPATLNTVLISPRGGLSRFLRQFYTVLIGQVSPGRARKRALSPKGEHRYVAHVSGLGLIRVPARYTSEVSRQTSFWHSAHGKELVHPAPGRSRMTTMSELSLRRIMLIWSAYFSSTCLLQVLFLHTQGTSYHH